MTSNEDWKTKDSYSYLLKFSGKELDAAWAWEFIRRSLAYRDAYATFDALQKKHGADWLSKQLRDHFDPPRHPEETLNGWKYRISQQGNIGREITASQHTARRWKLADLYDPSQPFDPNKIRFSIPNSSVSFYASSENPATPAIQPFEYIQHDFVDSDTDHLLFAVFDARQSINKQLNQLRPVFAQFASTVPARNPNSGQIGKWPLYLQFLDARIANPDMKLVTIYNAIGDKKIREDGPHAASSQIYEQAVKMTTEGYRGLLYKLEFDKKE